MKTKPQKMFVIKKYVMAKDAMDAIRKEKKTPVSDIWIDDEWRKGNKDRLAEAIRFMISTNTEQDGGD